jgi:uncharacterized membrane protein
MDKIEKYFQENPRMFGFVLIILGIIAFIATIKNTNWLFETNKNSYSIIKTDGRTSIFGGKTGKIIGFVISIALFLSGIIYLVLWD